MGLEIKRWVRQKLVMFLRKRNGILRDLAATEEMRQAVTRNASVLRELVHGEAARPIIEEESFFKALFFDLLDRSELGEDFFERILSYLAEEGDTQSLVPGNKEAFLRIIYTALENSSLFKSLLNNPDVQNRACENPQFCESLLNNARLHEAAASNKAFCTRFLDNPTVLQEFIENQALRQKFLAMPEFLNLALQHEAFRNRVVRDETLQQEILRSAIKSSLWEPPLAAILETLLRDSRLYTFFFGNDALAGRLVKEVMDSTQMRERFARQPRLRLEALGALVRGPLWEEACAEYLDKCLRDSRTQERILSEPAILDAILCDDRAVVKTATLPPVRLKLQLLRARETAAALPYPLPGVVLSYPRAGSNFLQSVLQGSSGLRCQSIYSPFREEPDITLTVKSHSPSPVFFEDEWRRRVPDHPLPEKIIRLQRDPRDVLISFLEYTEANRKTRIPQEEFLNQVDYFYASAIDQELLRAHYKQGMTVVQAFKEHVRTWYAEPVPGNYELLPIRYEDLVLEPKETFEKVFAFLNLDCELQEKFLRVKVSQYSDTGRARARIQGWRDNQDRYGVLIDMIQEQLAEEIQILGYEPE